MGACVVSKNSPQKAIYDQIPEDILNFDPKSKNKFQFDCNLNNVRIEGLLDSYSTKPISIHFKIEQIANITCPTMLSQQGSIKWKVNSSFFFSSNEYEIRSKSLSVSVLIGEDAKKKSQFKINLFRIIVGPYHHDFGLNLNSKNKIIGRVIFDLKIAQLVNFTLQSLQSTVSFNKEYLGDKFNFVIESYNNDSKSRSKRRPSFQTTPSYTVQIPITKSEKFRPVSEYDEAPSPTFRLKRKATLIKVESKSVVNWSSSKENAQMPGLKLRINAIDIMLSVFGYKLHRFVSDNNLSEFGSFIITLSQILNNATKITYENDCELREATIEKDLWLNGKSIGKGVIVLRIINGKFYKQMHSHSQTEDGIINMNPFQFYKKDLNDEDTTLSDLHEQYRVLFVLNEQKTNTTSFLQINRINTELVKQLQKLWVNFMRNLKSSYTFYDLSKDDYEKMYNKQRSLLKILKLMSTFIEEQDIELSNVCWKIVVQIMKRGEMMLRYWKFSKQETKIILNNEFSDEQLVKKIDLSYSYWQILYQLLIQALDFNVSQNQEEQNSQVFKAYCYFRVPLFRDKFLSSIAAQTTILESNFVEEVTSVNSREGSRLLIVEDIDWDHQFFKTLLISSRGRKLQDEMSKYLSNHQWFKQLSNRSNTFFNFIRYLMAKLETFREREKTPKWFYYPGYKKIVDSFINVMKQRQLNEYSSSMMIAGISLLENEKLFPSMLRVIYLKTNIYNQGNVLHLLNILNHFLHTVFKKNQISFPYSYFMKGIKRIFEIDCSISISHSLTLLYNFYDNFEGNFKYELSLYLLGGVFWKLFYHWSYSVRRVFNHIILLRICQDNQMKNKTEIIENIDAVFAVIANGERMGEKILRERRRGRGREGELYKKMREKVHNKQNKGGRGRRESKEGRSTQITLDNLLKCVPPQIQIKQLNFVGKRKLNNEENMATNNFKDKDSIEIHDITFLKMSKTLVKKLSFNNHRFIYDCFAEEQLTLMEIQEPESIQDYLQPAAKDFKQILRLIEEHYEKEGELPIVNLGLKIEIDEKEILPNGFDVDFMD